MIAEARSHYAGATTTDAKAKAASEYESAISRLLVITENYPTLQSSQSFRDLMTSLEGSENRISVERMKYNEAVKTYNISRQRFPSNIIASIFHFGAKEYFQIDEAAKQTPKVNFTN
jgi:LemA protein